MTPYTPDQISAAFTAAVEFFRNNPDKHLKEAMSNGRTSSPFDDDATCFCFGGYVARELGPLPGYEPGTGAYPEGYAELEAIEPNFDTEVYVRNDRSETIDEMIAAETELFREKGFIDA